MALSAALIAAAIVMSAWYRRDIHNLLFQTDRQKYHATYKKFLLEHVPLAKNQDLRAALYIGLLEVCDDDDVWESQGAMVSKVSEMTSWNPVA